MNERGTHNSCETTGSISCFASHGLAKCEAEFPGSLVGVGSSNICGWSRNVELFVPLEEVTRRALEELARTPVDLGISHRHVQTCGENGRCGTSSS